MNKTRDEDTSPLIAAARSLTRELAHFAALGDNLRRESFASQKSLDRGAHLLREIGESEGRLGQALGELGKAIQAVRDEQTKQAEGIASRAQELEQRSLVFRDLIARFDALGSLANQVNQALQQLPARSAAGNGEITSALPELIASVTRAGEAAQELVAEAQAKGFADLARNSDTLRQQILAARNKMSLLLEKLGGSSKDAGASDPEPQG